jgi:hypothetical protein
MDDGALFSTHIFNVVLVLNDCNTRELASRRACDCYECSPATSLDAARVKM